jgi:hypothetical protein
MRDWDVSVKGTDYRDKEGLRYEDVYIPLILWDYFRNGIAHAFVVKGGGIEYEADKTGFLIKYDGYLEIGPIKFFQDFEKALENYFAEVREPYRTRFISQFNKAYPGRRSAYIRVLA